MKTILIAQDICSALRKKNSFLDRTDMRVVTAPTHEALVALYHNESPSLVIADRELPVPAKVPVILVCENSKQAREKALRAGASAAYRRPIKPALVLSKAQKLLNLSLRETYRVLLQIAVEGNSCNEMFSCRTLDISTTGMQMETALALRQGDRISCSFYLPDENTTHIETTGEIVRAMGPVQGQETNRYGILFVDLSEEARLALQAFLGGGQHPSLPATTSR